MPTEQGQTLAFLDPKDEVTRAAERIRDALSRLGYSYRTKSGDVIELSYRTLGLVGDVYGLLEVDVQRLPPRVRIDQLVHRETLHHLTAVVGKPVYKLNTTGLTYCIDLQPQAKQRLPQSMPLDLDARPQGEYLIPIGYGREGGEWASLLHTSHILVGGESQSGKSTWLNAMLTSLLAAHTPNEVRLALIDPKGVEFAVYNGLPHLVRPVAVTPSTATAVTGWLANEMDRRRDLFSGVLARNLRSYNERVGADSGERLPLIVAVIDEVTDIALQCGITSTFYKNLIRLSSKGAAFGIVLVLATQNPKAEVLNTLIRGNLSTRIAFRVSSSEHSRTILGRPGAQRLPRTVRGRLLARLDASLVELQGYQVDEDTALKLVRRWTGNGAPQLNPVEMALVEYAVESMGGAFPIGRLYRAFKGQISHRQLIKLGQQWESRGWLTPPPSATESRRVTEELQEAWNEQRTEVPAQSVIPSRVEESLGREERSPPALHPQRGASVGKAPRDDTRAS
ncbi:MAG: FtsK/SpoIIIE domain-containing protein [Anaerolineae bacterium]